MAQGAIVFRWGPAVRGREGKSLEVFGDSAAYFDDLVKNKRISGHYPYFSVNRDGGMWILQGDSEELAAIQESDDFRRLTLRVHQIVEDYSMEQCIGGSVDGLSDALEMFDDVVEEFG